MIVLRPTPAFAYSHPAHIIAFGFGAGLARFAPGTFGTAAGWLPGWLLGSLHPAVIFPVIAALFLVGVWACGVTARHLGIHDHGAMVWDEIVAFMLVAALLPRSLDWQLAGFVLFRAFDIGKPPPIRWVERRWQGGFGVMFDDLVAAGYTLLALAALRRFFS
jgi:phosphatidylglycerophosphatase A